MVHKRKSTNRQYIGKEREVLEQDQHGIQIPINFIGNETFEMVFTNDGTNLIERIPSEILEKSFLRLFYLQVSRGLTMYAYVQ